MLQGKEIALKKKQLVLQSEIHRLQLITDWNHLCSAERWKDEGIELVKRQPVLIVTLVAAAGWAVMKLLRQNRSFLGGNGRFGKMGKIVSVALGAWKIFRGVKAVKGNGKPFVPAR